MTCKKKYVILSASEISHDHSDKAYTLRKFTLPGDCRAALAKTKVKKIRITVKVIRILVDRGGFEPPKSVTTDLQSVPFGRSGTCPYFGAGDWNRTHNLLITSQLLCQLSYTSNS